MDNLTHTLFGVALGRAGLTQKFGPGTTAVLAIASNLPDLDALLLPFAWDSFLRRRCLTHSVVGVPLLALFAALLEKRIWKHFSLPALFGLNLLGMGLHVLFDLFNSYGVRLLYPLSNQRFELAWVFIIDLVLWALLAAPLVLARLPETAQRAGWRATLVAVSLYIALCAHGHGAAQQLLDRSPEGAGADVAKVFPEALGPHRFRGAVRRGAEWRLYQLRLLEGRCEPAGRYPTEAETPPVQKIRALPDARRLEWFYAAPVWQPREPGTWAVFDLRFLSTVLTGRQAPFMFEFDARGRRGDGHLIPAALPPGGTP